MSKYRHDGYGECELNNGRLVAVRHIVRNGILVRDADPGAPYYGSNYPNSIESPNDGFQQTGQIYPRRREQYEDPRIDVSDPPPSNRNYKVAFSAQATAEDAAGGMGGSNQGFNEARSNGPVIGDAAVPFSQQRESRY
jgi:hypothetical protein